MIKRFIALALSLCALLLLFGCSPDRQSDGGQTVAETGSQETETVSVEQDASDYILHTDWMTFRFSKKDFTEERVYEIAKEAVSVMQDVRNFLDVNYTLEQAEETVCSFDSSYRNGGENRSYCSWNERKMFCVSLDDFVHEYVHMVSGNNADLVYRPDSLFVEGLAQYVSLNFYDGIASRNYRFLREPEIPTLTFDESEERMIRDLLSQNGLAYTAENYQKAVVAILHKSYDISAVDRNGEIYKYYVGHVFVDYCINQLGGLEKFMSVYCDCVTVVEVYGKTTDELVTDACVYNAWLFYGE